MQTFSLPVRVHWRESIALWAAPVSSTLESLPATTALGGSPLACHLRRFNLFIQLQYRDLLVPHSRKKALSILMQGDLALASRSCIWNFANWILPSQLVAIFLLGPFQDETHCLHCS